MTSISAMCSRIRLMVCLLGLGIDPDSGEITGTPTEDGVFVVTVTVSDGTESADTAFTLTVDLAAPGVPCSPVSTLPCADLLVALPFSLDFDGSEGGLADTGFTLVDAPSDRGVVDQSPAPGVRRRSRTCRAMSRAC